jgi:TolB-like protein
VIRAIDGYGNRRTKVSLVTTKRVEINLFGACVVRSAQPGGFEITGAKHKALFALLATAPFGQRTRPFLQETLWGTACYDTGRQSLRRALSDVKQIMGNSFADVLTSINSDIRLDLSRVSFIGRPDFGEFLEGIKIREVGFNRWLDAARLNPEQVYSLYGFASQPPPTPTLPAIAVLPFRTIAESPDHAILGDRLTEEVCRSLSRSNLIAVICQWPARALHRQAVNIATVRSRLAVDYCVVGTLRAGATEIVLDADFLDMASGRTLWTRQFAGPIANLLSQPGEGMSKVVSDFGRAVTKDAIADVSGQVLAALLPHAPASPVVPRASPIPRTQVGWPTRPPRTTPSATA